MAHTISATNGAGTTEPEVIEGYTPRRESRNTFHDLLDGSLGVVYVAPRPRSGTLRLLYTTRADALLAYNLHAAATAFALTSSGVADVGMTYALDGSLDLDFKPEIGMFWVLVGYQELSGG